MTINNVHIYSEKEAKVIYTTFQEIIRADFVPEVMKKYPDLTEQEAFWLAIQAFGIPEKYHIIRPIDDEENNA